ncbi:MAG: DNA polymerase III subunit epsilon [Coxiellaceae bacterium]|jgi:DNA polymerase-3 subunit epsilon|nr:DNA polymerase III subunit epsilon [Coxiellaceae bacterium]
MRQIVIDTETTGLELAKGHRIIEIGGVELIDRKLTGNNFHRYINPERKIEAEALAIHGITNEFLENKPVFAKILPNFLEFISGAEIIAHNVNFDVNFINYEIGLVSSSYKLLDHYVTIFDTLTLARKKFPGQRNTLDAICKRYKIDISKRTVHGALLDAQLLAEAYLLMTGGQESLFDNDKSYLILNSSDNDSLIKNQYSIKKTTTLIPKVTLNESTAHRILLEKIKKESGKCIWDLE